MIPSQIFFFFFVTMNFNVTIKNTIVGWGICTLFWGPTLAGLLYKWMVPPCNLHLTEKKNKTARQMPWGMHA